MRQAYSSGWIDSDIRLAMPPETQSSREFLPAAFFLRLILCAACLGLRGRESLHARIQASLVAGRRVGMKHTLLDALVEG